MELKKQRQDEVNKAIRLEKQWKYQKAMLLEKQRNDNAKKAMELERQGKDGIRKQMGSDGVELETFLSNSKDQFLEKLVSSNTKYK